MYARLRHAGILVESLKEAEILYLAKGYKPLGQHKLETLKMQDAACQVIELVKGIWHPHIAITYYEDEDGNLAMRGRFRHAGILVNSIRKEESIYREIGFVPINRENLRVLKMEDLKGQMFELVQGYWHPRITVNWYEDENHNYLEIVHQPKWLP